MRKVMNLKFNRSIQRVLNNFFYDEEPHTYTLGEVLRIILIDGLIMALVIILSFAN